MPNAAFVAAFRVHPLRVVHSSPDKSRGAERSYKNDDVSTVTLDLNPAFGGFAFGRLGNVSDDDMDMALCARVAELVAVPNLECAVPTLVPTDMVLPISSVNFGFRFGIQIWALVSMKACIGEAGDVCLDGLTPRMTKGWG